MKRRGGVRTKRLIRPILIGVLLLYGSATAAVPLADSLHHAHVHSHDVQHDGISERCTNGHDELTCPLRHIVVQWAVACATLCDFDIGDWLAVEASTSVSLFYVLQRASPHGARGPPTV